MGRSAQWSRTRADLIPRSTPATSTTTAPPTFSRQGKRPGVVRCTSFHRPARERSAPLCLSRSTVSAARSRSETSTATVARTSSEVSVLEFIAAGLPLAGSVTWFVEVENGGPLDAEDVNAEFVLPEGLALVGADSEQVSCSADGRTVSCALGLLEQSLGTVIIQVDSRAAAPGSYTATASITSSTDDPDLTNNESDYTVDIAPGTPGLASEDSGGCGCRAVGAPGTRNDAIGYLSLIALVLFARETCKHRECKK